MIHVRLSGSDSAELEQFCKLKGKKKTDAVRDAIRWYLANQADQDEQLRQTPYVKAIKQMTDRVCGMLSRVHSEVGTLYQLTYTQMISNEDPEQSELGKQVFLSAVAATNKRLHTKLEKDQLKLKEGMKRVMES